MDLDGVPYGGSRHPVEASLDGRLFVRFHLDIGMGDIQREPCEWVEPRNWLGFAGIGAGRFPSISREEHFAQKLHAYTMPMAGRANTRVKDLADLILLMDSGAMAPERLGPDIADTFRRRGTHSVPEMLEPPPEFWRTVFGKLAEECGIDGDMDMQFARLREFCGKIFRDRHGEG
jgi:hypothetical protein